MMKLSVGGRRPQSAAELLDAASEARREGHTNDAVALLRQCRAAIDREVGSQPAEEHDWETFLRLPMYLQEVGLRDEAWQELEFLGERAAALTPAEVAFSALSYIEDGQRRFLQREGESFQAVMPGLQSMISWARGLSLRHRQPELTEYCAAANVMSLVLPLLIRAKLERMLAPVTDVVLRILADLPNERAGALHAELVAVPGWPRQPGRLSVPRVDTGMQRERVATAYRLRSREVVAPR